jgi:hypothetical protein
MDTKPNDNMAQGKERGHQTQWAAHFAVASELCKRGYEVALTSGHTTPVADLMVAARKQRRCSRGCEGVVSKESVAPQAKVSKGKLVLHSCLCSAGRTEPVLRHDPATGNTARLPGDWLCVRG